MLQLPWALFESVMSKSLRVYEMEKWVVELPRLPNHPSWDSETHQMESLTFSGLALAHAVIQADFLDYRNPLLPGIGFILQSRDLIDWDRPCFTLQSGAVSLLSDFVKTSLVGRIGQGLTILFAKYQGYIFKSHLREFLHKQGCPLIGPDGKALPIADFICETQGGERAIFESKASVAVKKNNPSIAKATLKKALADQVDRWLAGISPPVAGKGFVVCSYLREASDSENSILVYVDPESSTRVGRFRRPDDRVRRETYAAWLAAMGLLGPAHRLRDNRPGFERFKFFVSSLDGLDIAFSQVYENSAYAVDGQIVPLRAGIALPALRAIEAAAKGDNLPMVRLAGFFSSRGRVAGAVGRLSDEEPQDNIYSLFPDGTFFGTDLEGRDSYPIEVVI